MLVHLVRHGTHALLDRVLCGRMEGVGLGAEGVTQAEHLAEHFARESIDLLQCSPRQRTRETAEVIAQRIGLVPEIATAIDELDLGTWTGRPFNELESGLRWQEWNRHRGTARPPGGESMRELQIRVVGHLEDLRHRRAAQRVVIVSHAEPIRAAFLHYQGIDLDDFASLPIAPASISTLELLEHGMKVLAMNLSLPSRADLAGAMQ